MSEFRDREQKAFSRTALTEAQQIIQQVSESLSERVTVPGITIDGPTSKDLDDAFWIERLPQGGYKLQISIADVGSFLTAEIASTLDREAYEKASTRYLRDGNLPMLPRALSEDQLSLLENEPRPAITLTLHLNNDVGIEGRQISPTMVLSQKRLSYQQVETLLQQSENEIDKMLHLAWAIAKHLLQQRRASGALAFYDLTQGWATSEDGLLYKLTEGERNQAHIIIQELMILANQQFASFFANRGIVALYRNHRAKPIASERPQLLNLLNTAFVHPEQVQGTLNVSLERAEYAPVLEGHFGLNLPAYLHMTSPLRRYADLVNQRILLATLHGTQAYTKADLELIALHLNRIEREMKDARGTHFLKEHEKQVISQVSQSKSPGYSFLDKKNFHTVLRMAAQSNQLDPLLEQEIVRRLEEHLLDAHDLYTLAFRFSNTDPQWHTIQEAVLKELQYRPDHATSILMMGSQTDKWAEPQYREIRPSTLELEGLFKAEVCVRLGEQEYSSSLCSARQIHLARQLAAVDLLAKILGREPSWPKKEPEELLVNNSQEDPPRQMLNPKGYLQELAQSGHWRPPVYHLKEREGPSHAPIFQTEVSIEIAQQQYRAQGTGKNKAQSEQEAAQNLLASLPQHFIQRPEARPTTEKDAISVLNEMKQQSQLQSVIYEDISVGAPQSPNFYCTCFVITLDDKELKGTGGGSTKKEARRNSAHQIIQNLRNV